MTFKNMILASQKRANTRFAPTSPAGFCAAVGANLVFAQTFGKIRIAVLLLILLTLAAPFGVAAQINGGAYKDAEYAAHIAKLDFLEGFWNTETFLYDAAGKQYKPLNSSESEITGLLDGRLFREAPITVRKVNGKAGYNYLAFFSYDRYKEVYRAVISDNVQGLSVVYEGQFENGALVLDTLRGGTFRLDRNERKIHTRWVFRDITRESFTLLRDASTDGGNTWNPFQKVLYRRQSDGKGYYHVGEGNRALHGYDPVAYFTVGKAVKGDPLYSLTHDGVFYRFANRRHMELFKKNPGKYMPQYGGWCAYGVSVDRRIHGYKPAKYMTDPKYFKIHNGKLYLFHFSERFNALELWKKDPDSRIKQGNTFWSEIEEK